MPALHTPTSFARSQCRRDALPPRPAQIRISQPHKEFVSGRLSPRDAEVEILKMSLESVMQKCFTVIDGYSFQAIKFQILSCYDFKVSEESIKMLSYSSEGLSLHQRKVSSK